MITLLLLVGLAPQEDVAEWVRKLDDESIEVRIEAERKLLAMGEPARAALVKLKDTAAPELKVRVENLLKSLDIAREVKAWFAPPTRITVSGEMTLEEAVREVERQSGQKVKCESPPEGKVRFDVKDAPYWDALDALCKTSGTRSLFVRPSGPEIGGTTYAKIPAFSSGAFSLRFDSIRETRRLPLNSKVENRTAALVTSLAWERPMIPLQTYLALESVRDEAGKDYIGAFREYEARSHPGGTWFVKDPAPTFMTPLACGAFLSFPEASTRLEVKGRVLMWIRAGSEDMELRLPGPSEGKVQFLDGNLAESGAASFQVSNPVKEGSVLYITVTISNLDLRMLRTVADLWHVKDKAGQRYVANVRQVQRQGDLGATYTLFVQSLPDGAEVESFVIRIPRRVVAFQLPFTLSDLPLK